MESFDYSEVPSGFAHCAADCPQADSCLRRLAYDHLPADKKFVYMLAPREVERLKGRCPYFRSSAKVRYARGFTKMLGQLSMNQYSYLRGMLLEEFGRKKYYATRNGTRPLSPQEQRIICDMLCSMGIKTDVCFDAYEEGRLWK